MIIAKRIKKAYEKYIEADTKLNEAMKEDFSEEMEAKCDRLYDEFFDAREELISELGVIGIDYDTALTMILKHADKLDDIMKRYRG